MDRGSSLMSSITTTLLAILVWWAIAAEEPKSPTEQRDPVVHTEEVRVPVPQAETATGTAPTPTPTWPDDTLRRICACESTGNPNATPIHSAPDGSVLRGRMNASDVGICQINLYYHEATARGMGLDLFTEQGNIAYARYLYRTQGARPWKWSQDCWDLTR